MTDALDFGKQVARFGPRDCGYIVDVLRGAYAIASAGSSDDEMTLVLGDFIEALEDCDSIELVDDEEMLVDAD